MWIDNVNFYPIRPRSGLLGFASVDLYFDSDCSLHLGNIAVYNYKTKCGYRITYPTRKTGTYQFPIFKPNNAKLANKIKDAILCHMDKIISESID